MGFLRAKYEGSCFSCDRPVKPGDLLYYIEGNDYVEHAECSKEGIKRTQQAARSIAASSAASTDYYPPAPKGMNYYPFQRAGIHFAITRPEGIGVLFADEMGLGKTVQALGTINARGSRNILIICPASLKHNWKVETEQWLVESSDIQVHSGQPFFDSDKKHHVQITNYDQLGKLPNNISPDELIVDEIHYIKNRKADRTGIVQYIAKQSKHIIGLTGTPIPNNPEDLFPLLQILDPQRWTNFREFAGRYCDMKTAYRRRGKALYSYTDTSGASNLEELQEQLRSTVMVRRLKKDVLKELPDKRYSILTLPSGGFESLLRKEIDLFEKYGFTKETTIEQLTKLRVPFEEMSEMRRLTGIAKVPMVIEHIDKILHEDIYKKIILFAHHQEVITELFDNLGEYGPAVIRGESSENMRTAAVERFQNNPYCRLFIGSIGAASVGLTLTASSHVVFAEPSWSPKDMAQAEDRAHRIGQKESVLVEILVFDESLDANIMKKVVKKMRVVNEALDVK